MIWQDAVIAGANALFGYSLVYQVWLGFRHKRGNFAPQASLLTTVGLCALAIAYFTLGLLASAAATAVTGTLWLLLFVQGVRYREPKKA